MVPMSSEAQESARRSLKTPIIHMRIRKRQSLAPDSSCVPVCVLSPLRPSSLSYSYFNCSTKSWHGEWRMRGSWAVDEHFCQWPSWKQFQFTRDLACSNGGGHLREAGHMTKTFWSKGPDGPGTHAPLTDDWIVTAVSRNVGPSPPAGGNSPVRGLTLIWKVTWKIWRHRLQIRQGVCRSWRLALPSRNAALPQGKGAAVGEWSKCPGGGRDACVTLSHVLLSNHWPRQPKRINQRLKYEIISMHAGIVSAFMELRNWLWRQDINLVTTREKLQGDIDYNQNGRIQMREFKAGSELLRKFTWVIYSVAHA